MGRGQYHLWSLAATYYAASAGASAFAARDPELAARLRALAGPVLAELERRRGAVGLLPGPSLRASLAGFDDSADSISCNGLALLWLQLALDDAGPASPAAATPSQMSAHDPSTGLATLRSGGTWLAVHATARHPRDARYDAGLLSALVADGDGWRPVVGERPNTAAEAAAPAAGPFVGARGPAGRLRVGPRTIALGEWRFAAVAHGVRLTLPCPRGARVRLIEWIAGDVTVGERDVTLPTRALRFSRPVHATWLAGTRSSATHERLRGLRLRARCGDGPMTITWSAR